MTRSAPLWLLLTCAPAIAAPPDQPPLGLPINTPNFNYVVRSGAQMPHWVPDSILNQTGRALDRSGTSQNGNPLGYHAGYVARGFRAPWFSTGLNDVVWWACANNPGGFDCDNGWALPDQIIMPTDVYASRSESCRRGILGHELFHHVEFGYHFDGGGGGGCGGTFGTAACEGQARALQDKVYFDLDLNPAASCVATFRGQVNGYLGAPDITIWQSSYDAALFWTYLMEQYGEFAFEPGRGIDFLVDWWDFAQARVDDPNIYQITEDAIRVDHPTHSVLGAYHDFLIANVAKDLDLSGTSEAFRLRYSYRDEEPVPLMNNLMQFDAVAMPPDLLVPNGGSATSAVIAERFGAEYRRFDVSACPAGATLKFEAMAPPPLAAFPGQQVVPPDAMFALLPLRGGANGAPGALYKWRARQWTQSLLQPATPYSHVVVAVAGWHTRWPGSVKLRCTAAPPPATLAGVSATRPMVSGTPGANSIGSFTLRLDDPDAPGTPLDTLGAFDIELETGGLLVPAVQKVREAAARVQTFFPFPALPLGSADLQVSFGGQQLVVPGGVRVAPHAPEIIIAIDTTASMGEPSAAPRIERARRAVRALLPALPSEARVGLMSFSGQSGPGGVVLHQPMAPMAPGQRTALANQLPTVTPTSWLTPVYRDVLAHAVDTYDTQGVGGERHLVLLTDSGDGSLDPDAFAADAQATGVRVHVVALDHRADQPLLARVAEGSGGTFWLSDADDPGTTGLLLPAVQKVREAAARSQSSASQTVDVAPGATETLELRVPPEVVGGFGHVKIFSGEAATSVRLFRPDGSPALPGADVDFFATGDAFAFHVRNGAAGDWTLEVDGDLAGGATRTVTASAAVVDPLRRLHLAVAKARGADDPAGPVRVGDALLVQAALLDFSSTPLEPTASHALIKHGTGTLELQLNDEGQHGDERAGDRVYSALFRATTAGTPTGGDEDGSGPGGDATYSIEATLVFGERGNELRLESRRQVTVIQDLADPDADADGLPDRYELRAACLDAGTADAAGDVDGDGVVASAEYQLGSDPCDVDSDGGGETDGSEIAQGRSPLRGDDDGVRRINHLEIFSQAIEHEEATPLPGLAHTLRFDSEPDYAQVLVRRAPAPEGPFTTVASLDAEQADGHYVATGLTAGATWCWQLVAHSAAGAVAAASDTACDTVRADNTAPRGSVVLDDGAPRTTSGWLGATLAIDGEPATGMQMNLRLPDGSETGWIPFATTHAIDASAFAAPATLTVSAHFRDAAGNLSPRYVDDIERVGSAEVGRLIGRVHVDANGQPGAPIAGASLLFEDGSEAGTLSGGDGRFAFEALAPGSYTLVVEQQGYASRTLVNVLVKAGEATDVGAVLLGVPVLFRDGFEG